ncbi:MAG: hypothetical protein AAF604_04670 [Acidobacteriota bacterium]
MSDAEIARSLNRTLRAVEIRRSKLGLLGEASIEGRLDLIAGPYVAPLARRRSRLYCHYRHCEQVVGGYTDAPISWPRVLKTGRHSPIVTDDLARAVRTESEIAVAHHWGVSETLVYHWRKALGVGPITEGTNRLYQEYKPSKLPDDVAAQGRTTARRPEVRAKMAKTKRGQGSPEIAARNKKIARRWLAGESSHELAKAYSVTPGLIGHVVRALCSLQEREARPQPRPRWTDEEDARLLELVEQGVTSRRIAEDLGRSYDAVTTRRSKLARSKD